MTQQERQGWVLVGGLFVALLLIFGSGYNTAPIFLPALIKFFGWKRAEVSLLPSALAASAGVSVIVVGWLLDRFEARVVMIAGALMSGTAFIIASRVNSIGPMIGAYVLLGVGITAGTVLPASFVIANWFGARRGLAMGFAIAGTSAGGFVMTLVASSVIRGFGLRAAYLALAAPMLVVVIPLVLALVRSRPPGAVKMTVAERAQTLEGFETRAALRTRSFWMILLAHFCFAFAAAGTLIHMAAYLTDIGYKSANVAFAISLVFASTVFGKVFMGYVADRLTARIALTVNFVAQTLGLLLVFGARSVAVAVVFVPLYGFTLGPPLMLIPLLIAESLGLRRYGSLSGILGVPGTIGAVLGPPVAGYIFDVTHSYSSAFALFIVIDVIGALTTFACMSYTTQRARIVMPQAASA
jgi:sugar phosphate permease